MKTIKVPRGLWLEKGNHGDVEDGLCVMEAVAHITGGRHTDQPTCACPLITRVAIVANDILEDRERQRLTDRFSRESHWI